MYCRSKYGCSQNLRKRNSKLLTEHCVVVKGSASLNSPKNGDALPDLLFFISQIPLIIAINVTLILTWTFLNVDGIEIKGRGLTLNLFI